MLEARPINYIREITIVGLIIGLGWITGLAMVVSWSFMNRQELGPIRLLPFLLVAVPIVLTCWVSAPMSRLIVLSFRRNWPLACLWAYMMAGGLYTRIEMNSTESFFGHAFSGTVFFLIWSYATRVGPSGCAIPLLRAALPFWLIMMAVVAYGFVVGKHMAHEIMYVFVPLPLYIGLRTNDRKHKIIAACCILGMAGMGLKNTTLIIGGLSLFLLSIFSRPEVRNGSRQPFKLQALIIFALVGGISYWGWSQLTKHVQDFSTGNTEFRSYNYTKLWNKFLASPATGDGFVGTPNLVFDLYEIDVGTQNLPSHSDTLDVLAHGGVVGAGLLLFFVVILIRDFLRTCTHPGNDDEYAARVTLFAMCVGALFTMSVNPVLANYNNAFMYWTIFGLFRAMTNPHGDSSGGTWLRPNVPREIEVERLLVA